MGFSGDLFFARFTLLEAPRLIACFNDMAVMGQSIQECRGHFDITKHLRPFGKAQVCRDCNTSMLIQLGQQVE